MKQFKCSMSKKIESLGKKQEAISGKNLMDPEQFEKDIREMIDGEYEKILKGCDDKERQYYELALQLWDDCGYDYAGELYKKLQQQMYDYVSGTDYKMSGNFANIAWDWDRDHKDGIKFADLRKKLLDGVNDADTDEFSTWAIDWFFHAFGTYNMCYNFANELGEEAAILEKEDKEEMAGSDESKKNEARECMLCATFGKGNNVYYAADDKGDSWTDDHEEAYVFSTRADAKKAVKSFVDTLNSGVGDHFNWTASKVSIAPWIDTSESKKSEALTKDTVVVGTLDNSNKKWIERTLQQIKKKFPNVESDAFGCTITVRGKLADVAKVLNAYPKGIPSWCADKGGDFLPNAAGDNIDDNEVSKVLSESKKSEGVGGKIKMGIDYNMFMRMCASAAYLDNNEDYWDALWEYFSEVGSIGDALVFFDNLFQYTAWKTAKELWSDFSDILGNKPEGKDYEEALDAYLEENDNEVANAAAFKYGDHYLMIY